MNSRLQNIDFLRIIACLIIIFFHMLYGSPVEMTKDGSKAVDFFFIISGFFFAYKLNLQMSLLDFFKRKLIRLYPVLIFVVLIVVIMSFLGIFECNYLDLIILIMGLSGTGLAYLPNDIYTSQFWYCSVLLWTLLLYFYLLKNYEKKSVNLFIALTVFFCYSFLIQAKNGIINDMIQTFYYVFNVGMMRGIAAIGAGYFIGEWYKLNREKINELSLGLIPKIFISLLEGFCLFFTIYYTVLHKLNFNQIIFIIIFALLMILFLLKKGFISQFCDKNIFVQAGKYTYSIFMTHLIILHYVRPIYWSKNILDLYPLQGYLSLLLFIIIFGVITYHIIEKPIGDYLIKKFLIKK